MKSTNLGIIFGIPGMESDSFEVQPTIQIDCGDDVLKGRNNALYCGDVLLL